MKIADESLTGKKQVPVFIAKMQVAIDDEAYAKNYSVEQRDLAEAIEERAVKIWPYTPTYINPRQNHITIKIDRPINTDPDPAKVAQLDRWVLAHGGYIIPLRANGKAARTYGIQRTKSIRIKG
jgi:hypothetical protein